MDETAMPGVIVILACTVLFPSDAVIVIGVLLRTNPLFVLTVNVALLAPAVVPAQLLGCYTGMKKGLNPDAPKNLSRVVLLD